MPASAMRTSAPAACRAGFWRTARATASCRLRARTSARAGAAARTRKRRTARITLGGESERRASPNSRGPFAENGAIPSACGNPRPTTEHRSLLRQALGGDAGGGGSAAGADLVKDGAPARLHAGDGGVGGLARVLCGSVRPQHQVALVALEARTGLPVDEVDGPGHHPGI